MPCSICSMQSSASEALEPAMVARARKSVRRRLSSLAVELECKTIMLQLREDPSGHGIVKWCHAHASKLPVSWRGDFEQRHVLEVHIAVRNQPRKDGAPDNESACPGRELSKVDERHGPRAPSYCRTLPKRADREPNTGPQARAFGCHRCLRRMSQRSTSSAGGIPSGIATSAVTGAFKARGTTERHGDPFDNRQSVIASRCPQV